MTIEQIKSEYLRDETDTLQAIEALQDNCAMTSKEAENIVDSWDTARAALASPEEDRS